MEIKERDNDKIKSYVMEIMVIFLGLLFVFMYIVHPGIKDITNSKKAEKVQKNLIKIRIALEEYYQITGDYPELSKLGASDNLKILDYVDENGNKISFADIYGKDSLTFTEESDNLGRNNKVFDTNKFDDLNGLCGWNYDYSGQTGEIHPNIPNNMYDQGIEWNKQ